MATSVSGGRSRRGPLTMGRNVSNVLCDIAGQYITWHSTDVERNIIKTGYYDIAHFTGKNLSRNILSSKYTLFAVVRYQTLIVLPYLTNGPAKIEGLTLSTQ
jgi:hypothetical protein